MQSTDPIKVRKDSIEYKDYLRWKAEKDKFDLYEKTLKDLSKPSMSLSNRTVPGSVVKEKTFLPISTPSAREIVFKPGVSYELPPSLAKLSVASAENNSVYLPEIQNPGNKYVLDTTSTQNTDWSNYLKQNNIQGFERVWDYGVDGCRSFNYKPIKATDKVVNYSTFVPAGQEPPLNFKYKKGGLLYRI
jgi:hypothetical protein